MMELRQTLIHLMMCLLSLAALRCGVSTNILTTASKDTGDSDIDDSDTDDSDSGAVSEETDSHTQSDEVIDDSESALTDTETCADSGVLPQEVLLIGDSWISVACADLGNNARRADVLDVNEDYVCRAAFGATMDKIVLQYEQYVALNNASVKVVVMNGGAVDTYGTLGTQDSVNNVVNMFQDFLTYLQSEGTVTHVIYALYANVLLPPYADLETPMRDACIASEVPCHFVELQPVWESNPGYTSYDGINPSAEGATAIADAIWKRMTEQCIAQ